MLRDSKLRSDRLSPTARLITVGAVACCAFVIAGLRGPASDGNALAGEPATDQAGGVIVPGVGWKDVRIGMKREQLLEALGTPDNDPASDWLKWADKHIDCLFYRGAKGVAEIRFNLGFAGALANGVKVGSPANAVMLYGTPDSTMVRGNAAKIYRYEKKGILFWTYRGQITQIVVLKPDLQARSASLATSSPAEAIVAGQGWKNVRLGMNRDELLKALGNPDNDPASAWLKWADKHIDCSFYAGSTGVSEIHFNRGFAATLANGVGVGSPDTIVKLYGKPEKTLERPNGAKRYQYAKKGLVFWVYQGQVAQIIVCQPWDASAEPE